MAKKLYDEKKVTDRDGNAVIEKVPTGTVEDKLLELEDRIEALEKKIK